MVADLIEENFRGPLTRAWIPVAWEGEEGGARERGGSLLAWGGAGYISM